MAGLDNIKGYAEGEQVEPAPSTSVAVKSTAPKSKYNLPSYVAPTVMAGDENATLTNMEELLKQHQARQSNWLENIKDAAAWTAGGTQGPTEALARRGAEREQQYADIFNIKQAIAQEKAQREQAGLIGKSLDTALGLTPAGQTTTAAGTAQPVVAGTAQPSVAGGFALDPNTPDEVKAEMLRLRQLRDPMGAMAVYKKWYDANVAGAVKGKYESAAREEKPVFIPQLSTNLDLTINENESLKKTGKLPERYSQFQGEFDAASKKAPAAAPAVSGTGVNAFNVGNVREPGKSTGFQQPKSYEEGLSIMDKNLQAYGKQGINTLEGIINRWSPPNENKTADLIKTASTRLGINPKQPLDMENPAVRQVIGSAIMLQERSPALWMHADKKPVTATAGTVTGGASSPVGMAAELGLPAPKTAQDVKDIKELYKKKSEAVIAGEQKRLEKAGTGAGDRETKMYELADKAEDTIKDANLVEKMATDKKHIFGIGTGLTPTGVATTAAQIAMPWKTDKDVENLVAKKVLSRTDMDYRQTVDSAADRLGIAFAADVFKGARVGIGLEKMAQNAKGIGTGLLPETNIRNANAIRAAAEFQKEKAKLYNEYEARVGKANANLNDFEVRDPAYRQLAKDTKAKLLAKFPDIYKAVDEKEESAGSSKFSKFLKPKS